MIPINALEQMNSKTLALIGADRGQHARPGASEIARNLTGIECPHSYIGVISVDDQRSPSASDAECGRQPMRPARERGQRLRRFGEIAGLMENPTFEREGLIGADAVSVRTFGADRQRLRPGQLQSDVFKRAATCKISIFDSALV